VAPAQSRYYLAGLLTVGAIPAFSLCVDELGLKKAAAAPAFRSAVKDQYSWQTNSRISALVRRSGVTPQTGLARA